MGEKSPRLWVGNLPWVAQRPEIELLFKENDIPYKNIDFSTDPFDGRNPSYCFVDFHNRHDANQALWTLPGKLIRGRPVKVNFNSRRPRSSGPDASSPSLAGKMRIADWRNPTTPARDRDLLPIVRDKWNTDASTTHRTIALEEGRRLFVGGLSWVPNHPALEAEMFAFFDGHNVEAVSKLMTPSAPSANGKPGSQFYCFVDIATPAEACEAARTLNGRHSAFGGPHGIRVAKPRTDPGTIRYVREQVQGQDVAADVRQKERGDLQANWRRGEAVRQGC